MIFDKNSFMVFLALQIGQKNIRILNGLTFK